MKFRKKPVVIEAYLNDGDYISLFEWANSVSEGNGTKIWYNHSNDKLYIETLEGNMHCPVGHYVVCGVEGEFYACEPNIFSKTYERVE